MSDAKERVEYRLRISLNEGKALDDALVSIAEEWQADKDELARLRKAIEDGPHGELCSSRDGFMIFGHKCDCWKRTALEGK